MSVIYLKEKTNLFLKFKFVFVLVVKMVYFIVLVLIPLLVTLLYIEIKKWIVNRKLRNFESPPQLPILGVASCIFGITNCEFIDLVFKYFEMVKTTPFYVWAGPFLTFGVADPQSVEILLTNEHCLNRPYFYKHMHCKTSILAIDKETWRPHRRALNAAFNVKMLNRYVPLLNGKARTLINRLQSHLSQPVDLYFILSVCMLDMITGSMMGIEKHLQSDYGSSLVRVAKHITNSIQYRVSRIWLRWDFIFDNCSKVGRDVQNAVKVGYDFIHQIYQEKMNELQLFKSHGIDHLYEAKTNDATNFIEKCLILEKDGIMTHENVIDELRVAVVAGIDTSSITVFGTLLMLAINQKQQDLVVDELHSIFESNRCDVTQTHLINMKYLERVIKETLRLLPPIPFIARQTTADIELPKGTIPKNSIIGINIMHMHRNPEIWGVNVLEFDPDRFLTENIEKRPKFSYIPFSNGNRNWQVL